MVMRGYCLAADVQDELGVTLTTDQLGMAERLIEAAEDYVDRFTGRTWLVTSPASETVTVPADGLVSLRNRPITAISSVSVRTTAIGAASTPLVAGSTYELLDAATGLLAVSTAYAGYRATVAYTHTNADTALPADVRRATCLLAAHWLLPRLNPDRQGLESYSVGGELTVKTREQEVPPEVLRLLRAHEQVLFA